MAPGFLQSDAKVGITWVSKLLPFGLGYWKMDAELVSDELRAGVTAIPTHICKQCKLLVGDYSQKEITAHHKEAL
jgi:hypothetical protein